jgi:hypothetical protein
MKKAFGELKTETPVSTFQTTLSCFKRRFIIKIKKLVKDFLLLEKKIDFNEETYRYALYAQDIETIKFLMLDSSKSITGQNIFVDSGTI